MVIQKMGNAFRVVNARFENATAVYLVGQFNNWSTLATPLVNLGSSVWHARLPLEADLKGLGFFVWKQGARLGRFVRQDEPAAAAPGV
jgi:hypothetical protein